MRAIGKENQFYFWIYGAALALVGWGSGFTTFEWFMGFAAVNAIYLLTCANDYLHLIGESLENIQRK